MEVNTSTSKNQSTIDSHQHFWKFDPTVQTWIEKEWTILQRDYLPEDLVPLLHKSGFLRCISVQSSQTETETNYLLSLAASPKSIIAGVVGWCNLREDPDILRPKLLSWKESNPKLVGFRHVIHDEEDDLFILKDDFRRGLGVLGESGLAYDLLLFPKHMKPAISIVKEFPHITFILDHIGKPFVGKTIKVGDKLQIFPETWESDLCELAAHNNVYCKVSGLPTLATWNNFSNEEFYPFLDIVFEAFGKNRVMIGSDWPVCTLSANYKRTMDIVIDYIESRKFSSEEKNDILGRNCTKAYKLNIEH